MKMQARDADRAQRAGERRQFGGQREIRGERFTGPRPVQLDGVPGGRLEVEHIAAAGGERDEIAHVPADAAAPRMRNEEQQRLRRRGEAQEVDAARKRTGRIARLRVVGERGVVGIQLRQRLSAAPREFAGLGAVRKRFRVTDEHVAGQQMPKPCRRGAQAEVRFHRRNRSRAGRRRTPPRPPGTRGGNRCTARTRRARRPAVPRWLRERAHRGSPPYARPARDSAPGSADIPRYRRDWRTGRRCRSRARSSRAARADRASRRRPRHRCAGRPHRARDAGRARDSPPPRNRDATAAPAASTNRARPAHAGRRRARVPARCR